MKQPNDSPCRECPFRRESAPGWLGADTPEGFMATTLADHAMPCHLTVDYERPDWLEQANKNGQYCAGALIFFTNICKLSMDSSRPRMLADKVNVFARPQEFIDHHNRRAKPQRKKGKR